MSGAKHPFIAMDDQTKGFARPSIIDIKMGQQTYEPGAPMSKVERTRAKYPYQVALSSLSAIFGCLFCYDEQEEIGFRVTGLKVTPHCCSRCHQFTFLLIRSMTEEASPTLLQINLTVEA